LTTNGQSQKAEFPNGGRIIARWSIRETMGVIMMAAILFLTAGRWDWTMGWAVVSATALWVIGTGIALIPNNIGLLAERLGPRKGAKSWDTAIMGIIGIAILVQYVVAGLDMRNGWSQGITLPLQIGMLALVLVGHGLVVWATASNAYFSQIVRIQTERGHSVATGGPYRIVRHPSYIGVILVYVATAIALGSWWALIPGGLCAGLIVIRTALEDRTLLTELPGYTEYAQKTRYRLIPGLW
jgi:protein-S-isoprenylcysteine O-methyltransferase Ste14